MIDYNTFITNVTDEDIRFLTLAAYEQRISTTSLTEADAYETELNRLFGQGLLTRAQRGWEVKDGMTWYTFDATVDPQTIVYIIQMAMERIKLSRLPVPV